MSSRGPSRLRYWARMQLLRRHALGSEAHKCHNLSGINSREIRVPRSGASPLSDSELTSLRYVCFIRNPKQEPAHMAAVRDGRNFAYLVDFFYEDPTAPKPGYKFLKFCGRSAIAFFDSLRVDAKKEWTDGDRPYDTLWYQERRDGPGGPFDVCFSQTPKPAHDNPYFLIYVPVNISLRIELQRIHGETLRPFLSKGGQEYPSESCPLACSWAIWNPGFAPPNQCMLRWETTSVCEICGQHNGQTKQQREDGRPGGRPCICYWLRDRGRYYTEYFGRKDRVTGKRTIKERESTPPFEAHPHERTLARSFARTTRGQKRWLTHIRGVVESSPSDVVAEPDPFEDMDDEELEEYMRREIFLPGDIPPGSPSA